MFHTFLVSTQARHLPRWRAGSQEFRIASFTVWEASSEKTLLAERPACPTVELSAGRPPAAASATGLAFLPRVRSNTRHTRILIVDSTQECRHLAQRLRDIIQVEHCDTANTFEQARSTLRETTSLVFVDTCLPDGDALHVIESAFTLRSAPQIVATGRDVASDEVFALAKSGVHTFLAKPYDDAQLAACVLGDHDAFASIAGTLRPLVGHFGMKDIQSYVRHVLVREALARTNGSRASAARVLKITRPAVQKYLRTAGEP